MSRFRNCVVHSSGSVIFQSKRIVYKFTIYNSKESHIENMIAFYILFCVACCQAVNGTSYQETLMQHLFENHVYFKDAPSSNSATDVYVNTGIDGINDVNEQEQTVTFNLRHIINWVDQRLKWNESEFGGLTYFGCPIERLWLPDLHILSSKNGPIRLKGDGEVVPVHSSGRVDWQVRVREPLECNIDVTFYPFDYQTCNFSITTLVYETGVQDILEDPASPLTTEVSTSFSSWSLVSTSSEIVNYNPVGDRVYRYVEYSVEMKRERAYYLVSVVLPAMFLSVALPVPFNLPVDGGERMGVSVSALTTLAVYFSVVSDDVPRTTRKTPLFAVYLNILLAVATLGVVLSMVVIRIHGRSPQLKIDPMIAAFVRKLHPRKVGPPGEKLQTPNTSTKTDATKTQKQKIFPRPVVDNEVSISDVTGAAREDEITWSMVAESIDRAFFVVSGIMVGLTSLVVLLGIFR